jgi:hypothetical protein
MLSTLLAMELTVITIQKAQILMEVEVITEFTIFDGIQLSTSTQLVIKQSSVHNLDFRERFN